MKFAKTSSHKTYEFIQSRNKKKLKISFCSVRLVANQYDVPILCWKPPKVFQKIFKSGKREQLNVNNTSH